jgi:hypothetical protein
VPESLLLHQLYAQLEDARARLKIAAIDSDWKGAIKYAKKAADTEDQIAATKAGPAGPTNVVGRPKVQG